MGSKILPLGAPFKIHQWGKLMHAAVANLTQTTTAAEMFQL